MRHCRASRLVILGVPILAEEIANLSATPKAAIVPVMNRTFRRRLSSVSASIGERECSVWCARWCPWSSSSSSRSCLSS